MKRTVALAIAILLCCGVFGCAEEESLIGVWERSRTEAVGSDMVSIRYMFTSEGSFAMSVIQTGDYVSTEESVVINPNSSPYEVVNRYQSYAYQFVGERLILTDGKLSQLFVRTEGTEGFAGRWELIQLLDPDELVSFLSDPEGYALGNVFGVVMTDDEAQFAIEFTDDGICREITTYLGEYSAEDEVLTCTLCLDGGITEIYRYRFEDSCLILSDQETHEEGNEAITDTIELLFKRISY